MIQKGSHDFPMRLSLIICFDINRNNFLMQLEAIMIKYAVPLAIVDGKSLAELAQGNSETERQPGMQVSDAD